MQEKLFVVNPANAPIRLRGRIRYSAHTMAVKVDMTFDDPNQMRRTFPQGILALGTSAEEVLKRYPCSGCDQVKTQTKG